MSIYTVNIIMLIVEGILLSKNNSLENKRKFCTLASLQWIIISGFRHVSIGADTVAYRTMFETTRTLSWESIINKFNSIMFLGAEGKDPGYSIFEKLCQYISTDYQVYLIIIALIFTIPLGLFIYRYSKNACVSFLIYSCLFYSFFAITGHRQTIVTGLGVLLGYEFIKKRKFWKFMFSIIILSTIHKSVLFLIPFYFIAKKRITIRYVVSIFISFIFIFIFKNKLIIILASLVGYDSYASQFEGAGTWTFTSIFLTVILVALWRAPIIMKGDNKNDVTIWYNAVFLALILIPFTFVDPSIMRAVQYFSIFIILLIPEIISTFNVKFRPLVYYISMGLMIGLFIKKNPQYMFFWQG